MTKITYVSIVLYRSQNLFHFIITVKWARNYDTHCTDKESEDSERLNELLGIHNK